MQKITLSTLLLFLLYSCGNSNTNQKIQQSEWLIGRWENKSNDGVLTENWFKESDSTLQGRSYFIKKKDTIHFEKMTLREVDGDLIYETIIRGQNNDNLINFETILESENELILENTENDYPQKVHYKKSSSDELIITITGTLLDTIAEEQFVMKKKNKK